MDALNQDPQALLCAEIIADARREAAEILQRAKQEAQMLLAQARTEAENARRQRLDQARTEAARRKELILAAVPIETSRMRLARIEALLESIHEQVRRRLPARDGFDYRETILSLAAEALSRMAGNAFVLKLSTADRAALGEELAGEIIRRAARQAPMRITIANDPAVTGGGLILQDLEGRQVWDNRLPERLDRLWPELRRQIALSALLTGENASAGGAA